MTDSINYSVTLSNKTKNFMSRFGNPLTITNAGNKAVKTVAKQAVEFVKKEAPRDTGKLQSNIKTKQLTPLLIKVFIDNREVPYAHDVVTGHPDPKKLPTVLTSTSTRFGGFKKVIHIQQEAMAFFWKKINASVILKTVVWKRPQLPVKPNNFFKRAIDNNIDKLNALFNEVFRLELIKSLK